MAYMLGTNMLSILITAPLAMLATWAILRGLDALSGRRFSDAYQKISEDADALARYHGQRFLGACILIGLVVLKSV